MRRFINQLLLGLFFGFGILLAVGIWHFIEEKAEDLEQSDSRYSYHDVSLVELGEGRLISFSDYVTIAISVKSKFDFLVDRVSIEARLYDTTGLFGECWSQHLKLEPFEYREIVIHCNNFRTSTIPEDTTFIAVVSKVYVDSTNKARD